jgi:hypothetical protein
VRRVHMVGIVAAATAAVLLLAGCSAAAVSIRPHPRSSAAVAQPRSDSSVAATCLTLETVNTSLLDAAGDHDRGAYTDAQYAAVINAVPMTLKLLDRAHLDGTAGLPADVGLLEDAIKQSPPSVTGAQFDPRSSAFQSAWGTVVSDCAKKSTPTRNTVQGG